MKRVVVSALGALTLLAGVPHAPASARPFEVEDLLAQEGLGEAAIDPQGRWLVFERRGPYGGLPRYDVGYSPSEAFAELDYVDLTRPAAAQPLLVPDGPRGLMLGPFSPSGRRLLVYRLRGLAWDLGVVDMATRAVTWLSVAPREPGRGRAVQWHGDDEVLAIVRPDGQPPWTFRSGPLVASRLTAAWAAAAQGRSAVSVVGSGAYAPVRARDPASRLLRIDLRSGRQTVLAEGAFFDLERSPDGRRVALLETGPDVQPRADGPVRGVAGLETEASLLRILDLASGRVTAAGAAGDTLPQLLVWSPDSGRLLVYRRGPDRTWRGGRLFEVRAEDGRERALSGDLEAELEVNPVVVRAGWLGADPVLFARTPGAARADWYRLGAGAPVNLTASLPRPEGRIRAADGGHLVLLAGDHLWRVDRRGRARRLSAEPAAPALPDLRGSRGARVANLIPSGSWMRLDGEDPDRLVRVEARSVRDAASPPAIGALVAPPTRAGIVVGHSVADTGVETLTVAAPGRAPTVVATLNRSLADTDAPRIEPVRHRGDRGEPLVSWLILPKRAAGADPPPLIVRPYLGYSYPTGPRVLGLEDGFVGNLRLLTSHGYAVLMPSLPSPPGGMTEPADRVAERILAVERAAREDPRLAGLFDPSREALLGWSFGAYTVMAAITQTDHFKAAVAVSGISDLTAYWSHISLARAVAPESGYGSNWATGTVESTQPQMGAPPWADPARYQRNSPLLQADRINTPLLLMHGWRDSIPYAGSEAMFSALFRQGKDAQLVTYWAADHRPVSPGDVRDLWARTFEFLDARLGRPGALTGGPRSASPEPGPASGEPKLPRRSR